MIHLAVQFLSVMLLCSTAIAEPPKKDSYEWTNVTSAASFPRGYNYPVFVWGDKMVAMNNGTWISTDGKNWTKSPLPESGLNSAYQKFVQFNGAIYSLGKMTGNYQGFTIDTKILRTRDLETWETVSERSNLPQRVFYGTVVFNGKIWMLGGFDGKRYLNDVWSSSDGAHWERVADSAEWSPRTMGVVVATKDSIFVLGGGVIDGDKEINPASEHEVWRSNDGKEWERVNADLRRKWRGTPVMFDNKLWLVGANRGGTFESAVWVTENFSEWKEFPAPWSPRGGVAAWEFNNKLYMTGGKSSHTENGAIKFVYSNDVWAMERKGE